MKLLTQETDAPTTNRTLNALDRCDRCSAHAYTIVTKGEYELLFCGHHGKKYEPTLVGRGWEVEFQLYLLEKEDE